MIGFIIMGVILLVWFLARSYRVTRHQLPILTEDDVIKGSKPLTSAILGTYPADKPKRG